MREIIPNGKCIKLYDHDGNVIAQGECWDAKEVNIVVVDAWENLKALIARVAEGLKQMFKQFNKSLLKSEFKQQINRWEIELKRVDMALKYAKQTNARRKLLKRKAFYSERITILKKEISELEDDEDKETKE